MLKTCFDDGYQPTRQHPIVFHLHGQMEIFNSIVVSEDDYLDFLVEMGKQKRQDFESVSAQPGTRRPMFPPLIQNALARNLLLFVGRSDPDPRGTSAG